MWYLTLFSFSTSLSLLFSYFSQLLSFLSLSILSSVIHSWPLPSTVCLRGNMNTCNYRISSGSKWMWWNPRDQWTESGKFNSWTRHSIHSSGKVTSHTSLSPFYFHVYFAPFLSSPLLSIFLSFLFFSFLSFLLSSFLSIDLLLVIGLRRDQRGAKDHCAEGEIERVMV